MSQGGVEELDAVRDMYTYTYLNRFTKAHKHVLAASYKVRMHTLVGFLERAYTHLSGYLKAHIYTMAVT